MSSVRQDAASFGAQLVALLPRLRRFAYGLTRSQADADDLVQTALERALTRVEQWEPGTRLDSWLYRILQNLWLDQRRAAKRQPEQAGEAELFEVAGEDGRETHERELLVEDTQRALAALPDEQRVVVELVSIEGLPYAEAAAALGVPIGTVMSRLARARRAIAAAVEGGPRTSEARDD